MDPLIGSALIGAGSSLLGGLFGKKSADKAAKLNAAQNERAFQFADDQFRTSIQTRVKDAKAAGIHPLYAIGAPGSSVGFSTTPAESGSALGEGLSRAGQAAASAIAGRRMATLNERLVESQIHAQNAAAEHDQALAASVRKRTEQAVNSGPRPNSMSTLPASATLADRALESRPWSVSPRASFPETVEAITGTGPQELLNPELGLDEVGQAYYLIQKAREYTRPGFYRAFEAHDDLVDKVSDWLLRRFGESVKPHSRFYRHGR